MLLQETIKKIKGQDKTFRELAKKHILNMAMPRWSLGKLCDIAVDLCGIGRTLKPQTGRKRLIIMAADHGIVADGVSQQPQECTRLVFEGFTENRGCICILAEQAGVELTLVDMGIKGKLTAASSSFIDKKVDFGTNSFVHGQAMTREQAIDSIEKGIEVVEQFAADSDIFGLGEMGIGNTSASSAIVAAMHVAVTVEDVVDCGAGLPKERLQQKIDLVKQGIALNKPDPNDAIDVLAKVGGFEIGGLAGVILGAAARRKVVVLDGFISCAAAILAQKLCPKTIDYMILSHLSAERGHKKMLEMLKLASLLDLGLRLGEGSGAVLAMNLIENAAAFVGKMPTFNESTITEQGLCEFF